MRTANDVDDDADLINVNNIVPPHIVPSHNDITTSQPEPMEPEDPLTLQEDILDFIDKILECAICLRLVAEPITIPCGHTFCRCCLVKSLQQQRKCPTCRAVCHIVAESAEESMMIKKVIILSSDPSTHTLTLYMNHRTNPFRQYAGFTQKQLYATINTISISF